MRRALHPPRGVSLIEALLALAVMAFGMLAVVGLQSTLRHNGDQSRQRTEALRLAQDAVEQWRAYSVLDTTANRTAYADIVTPAGDETIAGANATYTLRRIVSTDDSVAGTEDVRRKILIVEVSWDDRTNERQTVRLNALINETAPEFAATVAIASDAAPVRRPLGRDRGIPPVARDFGDGTSGYIPPQPSGVSVGWLFNNLSGFFTVCSTTVASNSALTARSDLTSCGTQKYLPITGFVRYATTATQPTAADVADANANGPEFPASLRIELDQTAPLALANDRECFESDFGGRTYREYACAVPVENINPRWSGAIDFDDPPLASSAAESRSDRYRICRYHANASYTDVRVPLANQNFVVIRAGDGTTPFVCPTGVTWTHQP